MVYIYINAICVRLAVAAKNGYYPDKQFLILTTQLSEALRNIDRKRG